MLSKKDKKRVREFNAMDYRQAKPSVVFQALMDLSELSDKLLAEADKLKEQLRQANEDSIANHVNHGATILAAAKSNN